MKAKAKTTFHFKIPGKPGAKQRPRFSNAGKFVRVYTPTETVHYEAFVKLAAVEAGVTILDGPLELIVDAVYPMKGAPLKRSKRSRCRKISKPDCDNLLKIIMDGLNLVAYRDDAQIAQATVRKFHAGQDEEVGVSVIVREISPEPYDIVK